MLRCSGTDATSASKTTLPAVVWCCSGRISVFSPRDLHKSAIDYDSPGLLLNPYHNVETHVTCSSSMEVGQGRGCCGLPSRQFGFHTGTRFLASHVADAHCLLASRPGIEGPTGKQQSGAIMSAFAVALAHIATCRQWQQTTSAQGRHVVASG